MLHKENLISNQDLMSHFLDPLTFNDKPVIAMSKTAFLILEFSSFYESWTPHAAHSSFNIVNLLFLLIYLFCKMILELRKLEVNFNY